MYDKTLLFPDSADNELAVRLEVQSAYKVATGSEWKIFTQLNQELWTCEIICEFEGGSTFDFHLTTFLKETELTDFHLNVEINWKWKYVFFPIWLGNLTSFFGKDGAKILLDLKQKTEMWGLLWINGWVYVWSKS